MFNSKLIAGLALAAAVSLAACSSSGDKVGANKVPPASSSGIDTYGSGRGAGDNGSGVSTPAQLAQQHSVYFDFDSSEMKADSQTVVSTWAKYLVSHPTSKVRLEGNTDERGTSEYNIALGERRGNTVAQALESQGVSSQQVSVISYGEERPVALGHDEDSWAQNRRVDLTLQ